ncbi:hypothetical protein HG530_003687 [Fusarium avenaceum]|nr:hypothetical protein HG530_003687 [Fusarium avenaceum]
MRHNDSQDNPPVKNIPNLYNTVHPSKNQGLRILCKSTRHYHLLRGLLVHDSSRRHIHDIEAVFSPAEQVSTIGRDSQRPSLAATYCIEIIGRQVVDRGHPNVDVCSPNRDYASSVRGNGQSPGIVRAVNLEAADRLASRCVCDSQCPIARDGDQAVIREKGGVGHCVDVAQNLADPSSVLGIPDSDTVPCFPNSDDSAVTAPSNGFTLRLLEFTGRLATCVIPHEHSTGVVKVHSTSELNCPVSNSGQPGSTRREYSTRAACLGVALLSLGVEDVDPGLGSLRCCIDSEGG